jgi:hypothetical protein
LGGYNFEDLGGFIIFEAEGFEEVGDTVLVVEDKIAENTSIAVGEWVIFV